MYVQVGFKRGQEPYGDKAVLDIKDGFLSFYNDIFISGGFSL